MVVVKKRLTLVRTPLDIPILIFMVLMILSTVFSVDRVSSLLGFYGRFSDNLVGILGLCIFYFLLVNNSGTVPSTTSLLDKDVESQEQSLASRSKITKSKTNKLKANKLVSIFLASVGVAVAAAYFSIFGLWAKIPWLSEHLPRVMGLRTFNPVAGSLEGLAIFLAAVVALVVGRILSRPRTVLATASQGQSLVLILLLTASVFLLLIVDFWAAWVVLGVTMLALLLFAFWSRIFAARVNILLIPIILVLISCLGLAIETRTVLSATPQEQSLSQVLANLPQEVILDYQTAGQVTLGAIKKYSPLGSGLGTFSHDFSLFLPGEFNQNRFWNIRFDKAPAHLLEMTATTGVLGLLGYLAMIGLFGLMMVLFLLL